MLTDPFSNALIITGPTASGKSALALEFAERSNAEIIAMDSMTLYRGMDIGTAKPSREDQAQVRHHLIDLLDPWESGNVAWWLAEARRCCREIEGRGKRALFVGGTPFYLKAILHGLFDAPATDPALRRALELEAEATGAAALHARLSAVDPVSAARLHPNDVRRVVRALEVWHSTGKPLSEWQSQGWWTSEASGEPGASATGEKSPRIEERCLIVDLPREELYARIDARVQAMFDNGWVNEVRRLRSLPRPLSPEASKALGYREIAAFLDGAGSLAETIALIQMRSRQFAKRQLTWFRLTPGRKLEKGKLTIGLWLRKMS